MDSSVSGSSGASVSFDRAAGFYDRTRRLSPETTAAQASQLIEALSDVPGPTLEVGVGTGRIALPLVSAGRPLIGLDLSPAMLARLREKAPDALPLLCADATRLPFRDAAFGAALVAHVLHLVSDWRVVVAELRRVVRPGGVLLATRGAPLAGLGVDIQERVRRIAGWRMPRGRLDQLDALDDLMRAEGAGVTVLPTISTRQTFTVTDMLASIEANVFSWTWDIDDAARLAAVREVRAWVTEEYGDPATVVLESTPIRWHRYRLPLA